MRDLSNKSQFAGQLLVENITRAPRSWFDLLYNWPPNSDLLLNKSLLELIYFLIRRQQTRSFIRIYTGCPYPGTRSLFSDSATIVELSTVNKGPLQPTQIHELMFPSSLMENLTIIHVVIIAQGKGRINLMTSLVDIYVRCKRVLLKKKCNNVDFPYWETFLVRILLKSESECYQPNMIVGPITVRHRLE